LKFPKSSSTLASKGNLLVNQVPPFFSTYPGIGITDA
jgi:hypothetical protein